MIAKTTLIHALQVVDKDKRKTLPFNGYAEQVAALYAGMDLKKFF